MSRRWQKRLDLSDVFHKDELEWSDRRDEMVRRVRALDPYDTDLQDIADELADTADGDEWDNPWDDFYDWADDNAVWVVTR